MDMYDCLYTGLCSALQCHVLRDTSLGVLWNTVATNWDMLMDAYCLSRLYIGLLCWLLATQCGQTSDISPKRLEKM